MHTPIKTFLYKSLFQTNLWTHRDSLENHNASNAEHCSPQTLYPHNLSVVPVTQPRSLVTNQYRWSWLWIKRLVQLLPDHFLTWYLESHRLCSTRPWTTKSSAKPTRGPSSSSRHLVIIYILNSIYKTVNINIKRRIVRPKQPPTPAGMMTF